MPLPKRPMKKAPVKLPPKPTLRTSSEAPNEAPNEANVGKVATTPPATVPVLWKPTGTVTTRSSSPTSNMTEVKKPKGFGDDLELLAKVRAALLPLAKDCITLRQVAGCVRFLIEEMESKQ